MCMSLESEQDHEPIIAGTYIANSLGICTNKHGLGYAEEVNNIG